MYVDLKGKYIIVHTDAHIDPCYVGRVRCIIEPIPREEQYIELNPGYNLKGENNPSNLLAAKHIDQNGTMVRIPLERIVAIAELPEECLT